MQIEGQRANYFALGVSSSGVNTDKQRLISSHWWKNCQKVLTEEDDNRNTVPPILVEVQF
jgi:hypothetical protein